jgi:hypothetical protein
MAQARQQAMLPQALTQGGMQPSGAEIRAKVLIDQAMDRSPMMHPLQAVGRVVSAYTGSKLAKQAKREQEQEAAQKRDQMAGVFGMMDDPNAQKLGKLVALGAIAPEKAISAMTTRRGQDMAASTAAAGRQQSADQFAQTQAMKEREISVRMAEAQAAKASAQNKATLKQANQLRDDFRSESKPFNESADAMLRIQAAAEDPTGAGDVALVFSFMKLNDPGSTVREGEQATARNAHGVPSQVRDLYNQVLGGGKMDDAVRSDLLNRSGRLFEASLQRQRVREEIYSEIATRQGVPTDQVVMPYTRGFENFAPAAMPVQEQARPPAPPSGFVLER